MVYNASTDLWYQYFGAEGPQWLILFAFYASTGLWAVLGGLLNAGIVYITIKSKSLHGICNILLATESGLALIMDIGYTFRPFVVISQPAKFVRYDQCFWALIGPCLAGDLAQVTMVCTGMDRLCAVLFPLWYSRRKARRYLSFIGALLCCYAIYDFTINYIDYQNSKDVMSTCSFHEMGQGGMGSVMKMNALTLSATLMALYSVCWFMVFQLRVTAKTVNENNRKLIKSLIFMIAFNLIAVFIRSIVNWAFQQFGIANFFIKTSFTMLFSFLAIAVYSANAPVLYIVSNEYRIRFNQHFPWLPKLLCQHHTVSATVAIETSTITDESRRRWATTNSSSRSNNNVIDSRFTRAC